MVCMMLAHSQVRGIPDDPDGDVTSGDEDADDVTEHGTRHHRHEHQHQQQQQQQSNDSAAIGRQQWINRQRLYRWTASQRTG